MAEKTVTNIGMRVLLDGIEEIMGTNGLRTILKYRNVDYLLEKRPEHDFQKNYTEDEYEKIISGIYDIIGIEGSKGLIRLTGRQIARYVIKTGMFDQTKEIEGDERIIKILEIYSMATGRGKCWQNGDTIIFDYPECPGCKDKTTTKPMCVAIDGYFREFLDWAGFKDKKLTEVKCKAMGDDTCMWEIRD
ncbi:MAG: hypothetical protein JW984_04495 [Deltaproteobacteria bacterium]|uniref:4-vinyl reductase 4VR domain-containing protein n=1 Tax=Candidatus Zymogenus saltonus TaxID=2844893 RepID=A0A9D8KDB5_9DELT|nr:hypothetical protein [Candidatus Zymogenus saltonus]